MNTSEKNVRELNLDEMENTAGGVDRPAGYTNHKSGVLDPVIEWVKGWFD